MSWFIATSLHLVLLMMIILYVSCADIISTIAGTGTSSFSGDNGQATSAALNGPFGVTLDSSGTHTRVYTFLLRLLLTNRLYS